MVYMAQIPMEEFREELNTTALGKEATDYLSRGAGGSPISVSFFYIKKKDRMANPRTQSYYQCFSEQLLDNFQMSALLI